MLRHYFQLQSLDTTPLDSRTVKLAIKSVANNAPLSFRVKATFTRAQLKHLAKLALTLPDGPMYKSLFLLGYFGFFRLATLVPPNRRAFTRGRYITQGDIIFGSPRAHIIVKCAKNMQIAGVGFKTGGPHTLLAG